jgi:four helix bundle suffix protein
MGKIRKSGGYRDLRSFQIATLIYDATYRFCERFLDSRSRMSDQMVPAARSGRQNIAEGSRVSGSSSQTELRLVNVARASQEELLLDYEDFLRHRRLRQWAQDSAEALEVRDVGRRHRMDRSDRTDAADRDQAPTRLANERDYALYARWLDHEDPAIRANAFICLIHQANYLLDQQLEAIEKQFVQEGGYSEQLAAARLAERERRREDRTDRTDLADRIPCCPKCGGSMVLRTARKRKASGKQFWGCVAYPECKGAIDV